MITQQHRHFSIKQPLTVALIGRQKFWIGIYFGAFSSLLIHLLLCYGREIFRLSPHDHDLILLSSSEYLIYNTFFAAVAAAAGFGFMIWFWFGYSRSLGISNLWRNNIRFYAICGSFILLIVVFRAGLTASLLLYSRPGYEDDLVLYRDFPHLLIMLPAVVFLNHWTLVRMKFIAGKWFLVSIPAYVITVLVLVIISPGDLGSARWEVSQAEYRQTVNKIIEEASVDGVSIDHVTKELLHHNQNRSVIELAVGLKKAFSSDHPVATDSIIMELVLIRKLILSRLVGPPSEESRWPFVLPRDVHRQMGMSEDSVRIKYLKAIMDEYHKLFHGKHFHFRANYPKLSTEEAKLESLLNFKYKSDSSAEEY